MDNINMKNLSPEEQNILTSLASIVKAMLVKAQPDGKKEQTMNLHHDDIINQFIRPVISQFSGNLHFYGEWDKEVDYTWDPLALVALVTYKDNLWMNKYLVRPGIPPPEDTAGWEIFPVKGGGGGGIISVIGDSEIVAVTKDKITTLKISDKIARTVELDKKENFLGDPIANGMLLASDIDGSRYFIADNRPIKGKYVQRFTTEDLTDHMLNLKHNLDQKNNLIYYVYDDDQNNYIPDITPITNMLAALVFGNILSDDVTYTVIVLKT